ncbi:LysR family transcriptional regulator [Luteimonas sp. RD2P54]|uniref:LysR family transcriptional regulator n=1 Tax=Luteimonas endophytica TaxID=3042023 RepID=A0ABT6J761_9GAMM|nr:LysR family transcriptional regulator [Luteimonas endophytica]MDH5822661.1 LysR family transcriptional regulator [Luteimonas endophytica]
MSTIPQARLPTPDLPGLLAFVRVAELGSFVRAADALGLSKAAVSKQVSALERRLGARLLHRTTRRLSLTEAGQLYLQHAQSAFAEARAAEDAVAGSQREPQGRLRVTVPMTFGLLHVAPHAAAFLARHPAVSLDLQFDDRQLDPVQAGFDLAIRVGRLLDSSLVARRIARSRVLLCAAPAYLERAGRPLRPDELGGHDCLHFSLAASGRTWEFERAGETVRVALGARLDANSSLALKAAAIAGAGIARIPAFAVADALAGGELERVLPEWSLPGLDVHAVMPARRQVPAKTRAFVDFMAEAWRASPGWRRPPAAAAMRRR